MGKTKGKREAGRFRRRWTNNMKTDLKRYRMRRCGLDLVLAGLGHGPAAGCFFFSW
jgi:hypothetical protein